MSFNVLSSAWGNYFGQWVNYWYFSLLMVVAWQLPDIIRALQGR